MDIRLLTIPDCPHAASAGERLAEALRQLGLTDQPIEHRLIATDDDAQVARFRGSPTFRIDGGDPFDDDSDGPYGVTCRVYRTPDGLAGVPTVDDIVAAIRARLTQDG